MLPKQKPQWTKSSGTRQNITKEKQLLSLGCPASHNHNGPKNRRPLTRQKIHQVLFFLGLTEIFHSGLIRVELGAFSAQSCMLMRKMNTISRKILYIVSTGGLLNKNLNVTVNHLKWISFLLLFRGALVLPLKVAPLFSNIQLTVFNIFVHLVSRGSCSFWSASARVLILGAD